MNRGFSAGLREEPRASVPAHRGGPHTGPSPTFATGPKAPRGTCWEEMVLGCPAPAFFSHILQPVCQSPKPTPPPLLQEENHAPVCVGLELPLAATFWRSSSRAVGAGWGHKAPALGSGGVPLHAQAGTHLWERARIRLSVVRAECFLTSEDSRKGPSLRSQGVPRSTFRPADGHGGRAAGQRREKGPQGPREGGLREGVQEGAVGGTVEG